MKPQKKHPSSSQNVKSSPKNKSPWKKPELNKLNVSLDTAFFAGSNADGTRSTP